MRSNFERKIELQMSKMLKFKYYGHHVMSRKYKCRLIGVMQGVGVGPSYGVGVAH